MTFFFHSPGCAILPELTPQEERLGFSSLRAKDIGLFGPSVLSTALLSMSKSAAGWKFCKELTRPLTLATTCNQ